METTSERGRLIALLMALERPDQASTLPGDEAILAFARHHRLTPMLSAACGAALPALLAAACRRDRLVTTVRNLALSQVAGECIRALTAAGVGAIVLKGLAYEATIYPAAGVRPGSDIDLLVRGGDRRRAFAVLDQLGFEPRAAAPGFDDPDYHEVAWKRRDAEVDLHLALAPPDRCRIDYDVIWRDARTIEIGATTTSTLSDVHAVIFHTLHMAIDHFHVPAIYLVDLKHLLARADLAALAETAHAWHCWRPLATAAALTAAFLPGPLPKLPGPPPAIAARIIARYGSATPPPRPEQLVRKLAHFDSPVDAALYTLRQSRRKLREEYERRVHRRTARERLAL